MKLEFIVWGTPVPQGSMTGWPIFNKAKKFIRCNVVPNNQKALNPWRKKVAEASTTAMAGATPLDEPVSVSITFCTPAKKSHGAKFWDETGYDVDKLERAILDGITGTIVKNDSRVVILAGRKILGKPDSEGFASIAIQTIQQRTR